MNDSPAVKEALKGHSTELIKGLEQFIEEYEALGDRAENARAILARWQTAAAATDDKVRTHWTTIAAKYKGKENLTFSEKEHYEFALKKLKAYEK